MINEELLVSLKYKLLDDNQHVAFFIVASALLEMESGDKKDNNFDSVIYKFTGCFISAYVFFVVYCFTRENYTDDLSGNLFVFGIACSLTLASLWYFIGLIRFHND